MAGGRWTAARRELAAGARLGQVDSALVGRAVAASLPFLGVPKDQIRAIRDEVERWRAVMDAAKVAKPKPV